MSITGSLLSGLGRFAADGFTLQRRGRAARRSLKNALQLAHWLRPAGEAPAIMLRSGDYESAPRIDWTATAPPAEHGLAVMLLQESIADGDRLLAAWKSAVTQAGELVLYRRNTLLESGRNGVHRGLSRWPARPYGAAASLRADKVPLGRAASPFGRVQILASSPELAQALVANSALIGEFLAVNEALAAPPGRAFVPAEMLCDRIHFHYQDGNAFLFAAPAAVATLEDARRLAAAAAALERALHTRATPPDPGLIGDEIHGITLLKRDFIYGGEFPFGRLHIGPQLISFLADERARPGASALIDVYERFKKLARPALNQYRFDFPRDAVTAIRYPPERPGSLDLETREGRIELTVSLTSHQPLLLALSREGWPLR